ncbi:MAG: hypothetical protein FWC79_00345 [Oscillospiraceae bacterium]|nr:hypothetical protein [Oscillospiraceae bacterium]
MDRQKQYMRKYGHHFIPGVLFPGITAWMVLAGNVNDDFGAFGALAILLLVIVVFLKFGFRMRKDKVENYAIFFFGAATTSIAAILILLRILSVL